MRYTLIAAVALAATAVALYATAQQPPPPAPVTATQKRMLIDWRDAQAALRDGRLQRAAIRQLSIEPGAPQPSLPLLLPFDQDIAEQAIVTIFPHAHSYAASMQLHDMIIEVHGERRALVLPKNDPVLTIAQSQDVGPLAGADVPYSLNRTEGGYDLTFGRFGAAYLISVECFDPRADPRCNRPDYIRALGERMSLLGKDEP